jgi:hypothetical protein
MAQSRVVASNPHRALTAKPPGTSRPLGLAAAAALLGLVVLDILSPSGPPLTPAIGGIAYGAKTLLGLAIAVGGVWALATTRLTWIFRLATAAYVLVVLVWFTIWLLGDTRGDGVTYLLNPTYSVWSWLMILMIPLVARLNRDGALTDTVSRIPVFIGFALLMTATIGMSVFGLMLNSSNAGVVVLLLLACRPAGGIATRGIRVSLIIAVAAAMIVGGYRLYAVAALVFALNQFIPRMTRRILIVQIVILTFTPAIFWYVVNNYSDVLVSSSDANFFDTRSFLFKELVADFSSSEIVYGRGLTANYYSPYFFNIMKNYASLQGYSNVWRTTSEIGWLNIILHLGVVALVPFYLAIVSVHFLRFRSGVVPVDGLRRLLPTIFLLFTGEMWNGISSSYFCWYFTLGALLSTRQGAGQNREPPQSQLADSHDSGG